MSIDISRVARSVCDLSAGSTSPLKLSHAQQCVAAAFGFKSLAAYQASKKIETAIDDNGMFVIIESDLLASRGHELAGWSDGAALTDVVEDAIRRLYPDVTVHHSRRLERVPAVLAISELVGLNPIVVDDLDEARYEVIENQRGEVQGFRFNFDEPQWTQHAAHIRRRHGSLAVFAPASFLRVVKKCQMQERFYFHGDEQEGQPGQFFCRACDLFQPAAHFSSAEHQDHGRRYFDAHRLWDRAIARWKLPLRRPSNAHNIVAGRAIEERRAGEASRGDFHRWVERQTGRDDRVGDLAKDIMRDEKFPRDVMTREAVIAYVESVAPWNGPVEAAKVAWREFLGERDSSI
ncbi:MAG: hypothetical protein E6Q67_01780 [Roseateles sp.]|nr:MAG: hypothetical protein E6Q67_01780 [Roseateles sp.]